MWDWLVQVFGAGFMPHGHCYLWSPSMVWLQVISNFAIGAAYVSISATLYFIIRRIRDVPFSWMYLAFGVFIITCGCTHFSEVVTVWHPIYWLDGGVRAVTAVASVGTAILLFPLVPKAVALADAAQQSHARGIKLETAYKDLATAHARARELEGAKTAFFANVSHELRTPLTLILGPLDRVLASELPAATRDDLEVARRNAQTLLKHVNDLLDVARLEAGRLDATYAHDDLAALARRVTSLFEGAARARRFTLAVNAPAELPGAFDPDMLERVLANLVSNAVKHVPEGGEVRVAIGTDDGIATISVADNGPGIPDSAKAEVFERFRQAAGSAAERIGGSGLGLAIAKEFVELHGGTIAVEDATGGGARFIVRLPLSAPKGVIVADESARSDILIEGDVTHVPSPVVSKSSDASLPLVLIVEDNADMRRHLAAVFADGHRVETAADGREALDRLLRSEGNRPDLIVSDLMMPRMTGEALITELRKNDAFAETPILVLSARAEDSTRVAVLRAGANDYVMKPFAAEEVRTRGANLIERSRARALREALSRAESASRAKDAFLALISHELRTPLAALQVHLELLRRREAGKLGAPFADVLRKLHRAQARLSETLEGVLEYSNLQSGAASLDLEPLDVADIVATVARTHRAAAEAKGLVLETAIDASLPRARGDRRLLTLALDNLVANALKFTEKGAIRLRAHAVDDEVRIDVEDTGRGIALEQQRQIFLPFEQLEEIHHKHLPGVGLGLALVRLAHEAFGGTIELRSAPGEGSTFTSRLPLAVVAR